MTRKRKHIPLKVQLAAALLQSHELYTEYTGTLEELYDFAKLMTPDQIISIFQLHHYPVEHADGGPDEPWNLEFKLVERHLAETKRLAKVRAKVRRLRAKPKRKYVWPSRSLRSRGFRRRDDGTKLHRGGERPPRD